MGFYGNATYYLPNGIAQDVVNGVITTKKLADNAVTAEKIANGQVHGSGNNDKSPNYDHIASRSIGTDDIAIGAIKGGENGNIGPNTIVGYNILNKSIVGSSSENGDDIESSQIAENTIGLSNMGQNSIDKEQIIANSISGSGKDGEKNHILARSIGTDDIAEKAIKEQHIENGQIHGSGDDSNYQHIVKKSIAGGENGDIAFNTITGGDEFGKGNIAPNTIYGYNIHDGAISSRHIANNSIEGSAVVGVDYGQIVPGSIGTHDIANNAITEEKLANSYLKVNYYLDEEAPTTLTEIRELLRNSAIKNTMFYFYLNNSSDSEAATMNGLTPGSYQAYPSLMHTNGAPGYWYLHNLSTDEHWEIEAYGSSLRKIYLNDFIDSELKEYDSVIELKNDLDQQPMKTYIIGMQRAVSNLPSGRYIALPTHERIGSMKPNRILIHLTTGVSYTLRTTSANTVIVSTYTGHPNTNSEWLTFNQFNETEEIIINGQSYGSGKIMLYNQYQYKDLPIHIWNWTYLIAQLNLSTFDDENKSFTTKCIIAGKLPAIGSIKNTTGKQLQLSTGQKIPNGASLNLPNPKDLEGNEIIDSELIKDYGYQIYMELVDFDSNTILCNIQYFQGLNSDLFPEAIAV